MSEFDVIVLGAGAAGLFCAFHAGQRGRKVLVLERSNKPGKKILMSGGGRCNFTNLDISADNYISANPHFCKSALKRYTPTDFIALVEQHGIRYHEKKSGQLFCDDSAKDILAMLLNECERAGVRIYTRCETGKIETIDQGEGSSARFRLHTDRGLLTARSLVIATGGLSIPTLGGSGYGYDVARQFGLAVLAVRAGLVPFTFSGRFKETCDRLSGVSVEQAQLCAPGTCFTESILFTHRGMSGPAALQLSSYWQSGESIALDLFPGESLEKWLLTQKRTHPKSLLRSLLAQCLSKNLVAELQTLFWQAWAEIPLAEIPDETLKTLSSGLQAWQLKPSGTEGYRTAEVTLGGIDTRQLSSKTMESTVQPGLYFIGEVVDVTGHLGGFNFQWAWSSAYAAAQYV
ncbi:MAG: NAD(P)/FAD-dependent oxidoreductase [Gammaproteobacteria bacterium]|nr:NAD(P)/FAD-dependent oxidoreductase [Gammaproteobacteria bacterium]